MGVIATVPVLPGAALNFLGSKRQFRAAVTQFDAGNDSVRNRRLWAAQPHLGQEIGRPAISRIRLNAQPQPERRIR